MNSFRWLPWKMAGASERTVLSIGRCSVGRGRAGAAPSIGIILAAWDPARSRAVFEDVIAPMIARSCSENIHVVIVENRPSAAPEVETSSPTAVISGSNRSGEFSAYDEGRAYVLDRYGSPDVWYFLNDRAASYGDSYLSLLSPLTARFIARNPVICGSIETYRPSVLLWKHELRAWCRTNVVGMSATAADRLLPFSYVTEESFDAHIPSLMPAANWTLAAWLGEAYASKITHWLTSPDGWYLAEPLSADSWPKFRLKLRAILNEHTLSIRASDANFTLLGYQQASVLAVLEATSADNDSFLLPYQEYPYLADDRFRRPEGRILTATAVALAVFGLYPTALLLFHKGVRSHRLQTFA